MNIKELPIFIDQEKEPETSLEDLCQKLIDYKANANFMAVCIWNWLKDKKETPDFSPSKA